MIFYTFIKRHTNFHTLLLLRLSEDTVRDIKLQIWQACLWYMAEEIQLHDIEKVCRVAA